MGKTAIVIIFYLVSLIVAFAILMCPLYAAITTGNWWYLFLFIITPLPAVIVLGVVTAVVDEITQN